MEKEKVTSLSETDISRKFLRLPVFIVLAVSLAAMYLGVMPEGIIGNLCILLPLALILDWVGGKIPILKDYLGGSPLLIIFAGAGLVYFGVFPKGSFGIFSAFMKDSGTNFLNFFICSLVTGAIFGINSKMLIQAGLRYAVPLIGCIAASLVVVPAIAMVMGYPWKVSILAIALPILGGGMGGGAVPMAQIVKETTGQDMISIFVPALALGNTFSIIAAALLDRLGKKIPRLTGDGQLMGNSDIASEEPEMKLTATNMIIGMAVATGFFAVGKILNHFISPIHELAMLIFAVAACKIAGIIPEYIITACYCWYRFMLKAFTSVILISIGIVYTNLGDLFNAITLNYILLCASCVIAAILGAGFGGMLVGFHFVESAITAGLCMANMGGTGDVAVLSACKRMNLMPFARFSTSIGGGFIIFLCGVLVKFLTS